MFGYATRVMKSDYYRNKGGQKKEAVSSFPQQMLMASILTIFGSYLYLFVESKVVKTRILCAKFIVLQYILVYYKLCKACC